MNYELLIIFIVANIVNVVIQTVKSICTVKCGKGVASLVNAIAYGLYTYIIILTVCDLPMWLKALIVAGCNLVGVYVVKFIEEKKRKDRLWKIEVTLKNEFIAPFILKLKEHDIPHSYINISKRHTLFNIYCERQYQTKQVAELIKEYNAKYFIAENKGIL